MSKLDELRQTYLIYGGNHFDSEYILSKDSVSAMEALVAKQMTKNIKNYGKR